jgi:hypothetical protein
LEYVKKKMRWDSWENEDFLSAIWSVCWVEFVDYETSVPLVFENVVLKMGCEIGV